MSYGDSLAGALKVAYLDLGAFTANTSVTPEARFGCPAAAKNGVRIHSVDLLGSSIPSDPDGVLLVNLLVNDVSEGGDDTIVSSEDLETLMVAANRFYPATLAADGAEKILTIFPGDSVRATLVSDSAAITTNPNVTVAISYFMVPDPANVMKERVGHASDYTAVVSTN